MHKSLTLESFLTCLSETDKLTDINSEYVEITSVPRLGTECSKILAEYGYWETHDFGPFTEHNKYARTKDGYTYKDTGNNKKYCSWLLSFFEHRNGYKLDKESSNTTLYLKILNGKIVSIGLLYKTDTDNKKIPFNSSHFVETMRIGELHLYVPEIYRKNRFATSLAEYIQHRTAVLYPTQVIPVIGAFGRALPLLQRVFIYPVTPRDYSHCSYVDHVKELLSKHYSTLAERINVPFVRSEQNLTI